MARATLELLLIFLIIIFTFVFFKYSNYYISLRDKDLIDVLLLKYSYFIISY